MVPKKIPDNRRVILIIIYGGCVVKVALIGCDPMGLGSSPSNHPKIYRNEVLADAFAVWDRTGGVRFSAFRLNTWV